MMHSLEMKKLFDLCATGVNRENASRFLSSMQGSSASLLFEG